MIRVERCAEPEVLKRNKNNWTQALVSSPTPSKRERALLKYRHPQVKRALVELFHGKCAYCESNIRHVDFGHIEHFRPKSKARYLNLVFEWKNLFLACSICNGPNFKWDRFPEELEGGPPVNPCDDIPEEHFRFIFDPKAKVATVTAKTRRGEVTIALLGLNRPDLRAYRSKFVEKLVVLSRFAENDDEAKELLELAMRDEGEFAAFIRAI